MISTVALLAPLRSISGATITAVALTRPFIAGEQPSQQRFECSNVFRDTGCGVPRG